LSTQHNTVLAENQPVADFTVDKKDKTHWFDIKNLGVEGKGWTDRKPFMIACPLKPKALFVHRSGRSAKNPPVSQFAL